jgi:hypothetical protein
MNKKVIYNLIFGILILEIMFSCYKLSDEILENKYKNYKYIDVIYQFSENNIYDINTNNCVVQSLNLKEKLNELGYDAQLIELKSNDINKTGHLIISVNLYIDSVLGKVYNQKDFFELYNQEFDLDNIQNITNTDRLDYILKYDNVSKDNTNNWSVE